MSDYKDLLEDLSSLRKMLDAPGEITPSIVFLKAMAAITEQQNRIAILQSTVSNAEARIAELESGAGQGDPAAYMIEDKNGVVIVRLAKYIEPRRLIAVKITPLCAAPPADKVHNSHPDDLAVDRFAVAMKEKMTKQRTKGYGGWDDPEDCCIEFLQDQLIAHLEKGDPVDVGNFAMMIHQRGGKTVSPTDKVQDALTDKQIEDGWHKTFSTDNPYCPCNLKSFAKAVRWAESAIRALKSAPPQGVNHGS